MQNGQGKCIPLRHVPRHRKIEILGQMPDKNMLFKYHQAKYEKDQGRIFSEKFALDRRLQAVITDFTADFPGPYGLCRRQMLSRGTYPQQGHVLRPFAP